MERGRGARLGEKILKPLSLTTVADLSLDGGTRFVSKILINI